MYNINLSLRQYQEVRLMLKNYNFSISTRSDIDVYKKSLLPAISVENIKTYCSIHELVNGTVTSLASGEIAFNNHLHKGQCHKPMPRDLHHFAYLHAKLRSLDFCLKLFYHVTSRQTHTWSESNANVRNAINLAKDEIIKHIGCNCHMVLDIPTSNGGNKWWSNSRSLFSKEKPWENLHGHT